MSKKLLKYLYEFNLTEFSLNDLEKILPEYFDEKEPSILAVIEKESVIESGSYRFLKTLWYYGKKQIPVSKWYKHIIFRIQAEHESACRKLFNIDDRQQFSYDACQKSTDFLDITGFPPYADGDTRDKYSSNPKIKVIFSNKNEYDDFKQKLSPFVKLTDKTKTAWYPSLPSYNSDYPVKYWSSTNIKNEYTIYIPSFQRSENMITVKALLDLGIYNFFVVVRPEEEDKYKNSLNKLNLTKNLLVVPQSFLDSEKLLGNINSIPQRNYAYNHSVDNCDKYHWCLDDNINGFYRRYDKTILPFKNTSYPFVLAERSTKRFQNVALTCLQYKHLSKSSGNRPMIILNSKAYSCILIKNTGLRWRGSYNEDIILTLDSLIKGYSTMTFENILCNKCPTGTTRGGNQSIYKNDGQTKKIDFLMTIHPKYVKKIQKYNHDHHSVDYQTFKKNDTGYTKDVDLNLPDLIGLK